MVNKKFYFNNSEFHPDDQSNGAPHHHATQNELPTRHVKQNGLPPHHVNHVRQGQGHRPTEMVFSQNYDVDKLEKNQNGFNGPELNLDHKKSSTTSKKEKLRKWGMLKNVVIISFAFLCLFTSFNSLGNLQSSINKKLGTTSLWVIYVALVVSCALLPTLMIKKLRVKWTMVVCMLAYSTYMAAQFYPRYYTLIPAAIILGTAAASLWSAKCTYLTLVGEKYADLTGQRSEVIVTRFFGIFFMFFQCSQVIGNLISSSVLSVNVTEISRDEEHLNTCGLNFCPEPDDPESPQNSTKSAEEAHKITVMSGIYLGCALVSVVIVAFLVDPLKKYGEKEREAMKEDRSTLGLLLATFNQLKNPYQILIIPMTFWSGLEQGFFGADFTAGWVTCGMGVHMVGYVMICYGVCDSLCSIGFSPIVKKFGRVPVYITGALVNVIVIVIMFTWRPDPDQKYLFFIMAGLWGLADAIWQTQINAFYGVIFPGESEAAFSNYRLWESLGFILAYALSSTVCIRPKLFIVLSVLGLGMTGYLTVEALESRRKKSLK